MKKLKHFPHYSQQEAADCGPTIIVNNHLLPTDTYQIEDLINL